MKQSSNKDWNLLLHPLFTQYHSRKHPLEYKNTYQLVVMVVLSAQTTDAIVNAAAPALFQRYPSLKQLALAHSDELHLYLKTIRGYRRKADWLINIAKVLGDESNIPLTIDRLIELPGIGRKSANVIIREADGEPQGIFLDLHVLRVIPRIGITNEASPEKMEKVLMGIISREHWHDAGISFSYLGRELCRPTDPICRDCLLNEICEFKSAHKNSTVAV